MVRHVDAIFSQGAFRPISPLALAEGTRVRLSIVEEDMAGIPARPVAKIHTPKLARSQDGADFVMEVRRADNAAVDIGGQKVVRHLV